MATTHLGTPDVHAAVDLVVLSILPHSRVLQVGLQDGTYSRKLAARGCRLWAVARGVHPPTSETWCEGVAFGDLQSLDLGHLLGTIRVDAVLFADPLDCSEYSAGVVRSVAPFLAPGGRMVFASIAAPELTAFHRFARDEGLRVIEAMPAVRLSSRVPADVDSVERFVVVTAIALTAETEVLPTLASALMDGLCVVERECVELRARTRDAEAQVVRYQDEISQLRAARDEAREWHRRSADEVLAARDHIRRLEADAQRSREQLEAHTSELSRCQVQLRFLRDDVVVKDEYLATLRDDAVRQQRALEDCQATCREESARQLQTAADLAAITGRLHQEAAAHASAIERNVALERLNDECQRALDAMRAELQQVHVSVATTLAQPRYAVADRLNAWARRFRFVHAPLKRVWLARHPR